MPKQSDKSKPYGLWAGIALAVVVLIGIFFILQFADDTGESNGLTPADSMSHAHGLAVDVQDSGKVYIATHSGLFLLEDDGQLYKIGNGRDDLMGFSAHPDDSDVFYASGHPITGGNLGLQKSEDGGRSWEKISDGLNGPVDFHSMSVSQVDPGIIYGYHGGLQRSLDGGESWKTLETDLPDLVSLVTDSEKKDTVYAATAAGLYVSRDQGETWEVFSLADEAVAAVALKPGNNQELLASTPDNNLKLSQDGGQIWETIETDSLIMHLAYARSESDTVYAVTRDDEVLKSTNGGQDWEKVY